MNSKTVAALFDNAMDARAAMDDLARIGISRSDINLSRQDEGDTVPRAGSADTGDGTGHGGGFLDAIKSFFGAGEEAGPYAEGVRRGGTLLVARLTDEQIDQAVRVMEDHGPVDIEERSATWRREGWTPNAAAAEPPTQRETATRDDETVIPIMEEELHVGKRDVQRGRVRVHTRIVETPVDEEVTLRDESVVVERRSATGTAADLGGDAFRERTIEMTEHDEEAVVSKQAHIKEELVVRKDVQQRTERVRDKVRRTEVDIDDDRVDPRLEPASDRPKR